MLLSRSIWSNSKESSSINAFTTDNASLLPTSMLVRPLSTQPVGQESIRSASFLVMITQYEWKLILSTC